MKNLSYQITFYSEWHCSSGLSAGADTDALVIKDVHELPYIPGKTVKGLLREAAEELIALSPTYRPLEEAFERSFGAFDDKAHARKGEVFVSNAELSEKERAEILNKDLRRFLYRRFTSTKIDEQGVAQDSSLRSMETVIPCTLHGNILFVAEELEGLLKDAARMIKRMGSDRNRGLGRMSMSINLKSTQGQ
jgi:CRISPR/Cas system CSM-associated protein Csm3 (group 7 of RAMP superfamily)